MAKHLCYMSKDSRDNKKLQAVLKLIEAGSSKPASYLSDTLKMKSRQVARLLKRIECIKREKKYNRFHYEVDVEPPEKIRIGDIEVKIDKYEDDGGEFIEVQSSNGMKKEIKLR